jgi:16S rRNA (guanine527-N7)-methyltransferase
MVPHRARGPAQPGLDHPLLKHLPDNTLDRLRLYETLLRKWQRVINLVSPSSLDDIWVRHFADSLQVSDAVPEARRWVDLGSGGGFPGLVTAIRFADEPGTRIHLIESDRRKCAFLREVSRETKAPAIIHCGRIEQVVPTIGEPIDAISARALAPLDRLIHYAAPLLDRGAVGVFPKGKRAEVELTRAFTTSKYLIAIVESHTDPESQIILVQRDPARAG